MKLKKKKFKKHKRLIKALHSAVKARGHILEEESIWQRIHSINTVILFIFKKNRLLYFNK